jgi:hypothetical protein
MIAAWNSRINPATNDLMALGLSHHICARLVLLNMDKRPAKQFPLLGKKLMYFDVPDGIIAHLTRECGGNVHDCHVVEVRSGSFEKETYGANPDSGAYDNRLIWLGKMLLILKPVHISIELVARKKKIFFTRGTIGYATISMRGGLRQQLRNPQELEWSERLASEILARRDVGGREEVAGGRPRRGHRPAQRTIFYWHICGCGRRGVPLHPAGEYRKESPRE